MRPVDDHLVRVGSAVAVGEDRAGALPRTPITVASVYQTYSACRRKRCVASSRMVDSLGRAAASGPEHRRPRHRYRDPCRGGTRSRGVRDAAPATRRTDRPLRAAGVGDDRRIVVVVGGLLPALVAFLALRRRR